MKTLHERFWSKVDIKDYEQCWEWKGARSKTGSVYYGFIGIAGKNALVHRVSYQMRFGFIPDGLILDHLCRNTLCVNPSHLEAVTFRVNTLRGFSPTSINAAKTHCIKGHEFTTENTYLKRGEYNPKERACRECRKRIKREWARKKYRENKRQ